MQTSIEKENLVSNIKQMLQPPSSKSVNMLTKEKLFEKILPIQIQEVEEKCKASKENIHVVSIDKIID